MFGFGENQSTLPSQAARKGFFKAQEEVSPYAERAYVFLTEPNSSVSAFRYSAFMSFCVILNAIFLVLETVDGPNHYEDRKNMSTYRNLPNEQGYVLIQEILMAPMCADAAIRMGMFICVFFSNTEILDDFQDDKFKLILFLFDILSIVPFIIRVSYVYPSERNVSQLGRLVLRVLDLLSSGKILRASKDIPAIVAIRIALSRSMEHLVLPLFFFLVFNVFFGVVVYFMEPCYDYDTCAWKNLFDACFFSVVTMTTTGYGNQVPLYLPARMIAVIIMLFGSLFMSMPLAIIGNEYASAWESLQEQMKARAIEAASEDVHELDILALQTSLVPPEVGKNLRRKSEDGPTGRLRSASGGLEPESTVSSPSTPLLDCRKNLELSLVQLRGLTSTARKMNPAMLLAVCELRGWISPLLWNIRTAVSELAGEDKFENSRRVSFMRQSITNMGNNESWEDHLRHLQSAHDQPNSPGSVALNAAAHGGFRFESQLEPLEEDDGTTTTSPGKNLPLTIGTSRHPRAHDPLPADETLNPSFVPGPAGSPLRPSFWPFLPFKSWLGSKPGVSPDPDSSRDSSALEMNEAGRKPALKALKSMASIHEFSEDNEDGDIGSTPESALSDDKNTSSPNQEDKLGALGARRGHRVAPISPKRPPKTMSKLTSGEFTSNITKTLLKRDQSSTFIVKIARAAPDIANMRGDGVEFARNMERAVKNPKALRTRVWMVMEFPHSSKGARLLQFFLLFLILLSVLMLYTQTLPTFSHYGEDSSLCGKVLDRYCADKNDVSLDPGCFAATPEGPSDSKMKYGCSQTECFAHGVNYGAKHTNVTCSSDVRPFQTQDQLIKNYRAADFVVSRDTMHKIQDVCQRIECDPSSQQIVNGNKGWIPVEIFINSAFTIEIILRIFVSSSLYGFFIDPMNIFDILSVVPFYVDMINNPYSLDFAILASSPEPILLVALKSMKVFRLFKMTRHFSASQVLVATANKAWRQIVGILSLLFFIVAVFSLLLYEVEQGTPCYVGDSNCKVPDDIADTMKDGQRISIDKSGEVSKFGNVLDSLWFSIVTLTSVGYGEIVPVTNVGQMMTLFLMLFGAIYLSMPLTVAATTFWDVHQLYLEKQNKKKQNASKKIMDALFVKRMKSLETSLLVVSKKLDSFFKDIQEPSDGENRLTFLERCKDIENTLSKTLTHHDPDLRRLSVAYSSHMHGGHNGSRSASTDFGEDSHLPY